MANRVKLNKETVEKLFDTAKLCGLKSNEVADSLYKAVLPEWDRIASISGYPGVNEKTSKALFGLFIEHDRIVNPDYMAGGLWMNNGFSSGAEFAHLADWEVDLSRIEIVHEVAV